MMLIAVASPRPLHGQDEGCGDSCRINSNLAMVINVPVNPTAQVASGGWGTIAGVGYNFNKQHALIGEFLWNRMYANSGTLQAIQAAALPIGNLDGSTDIYSLTANYRFELRGDLFGAYLIGGGGWYLRHTNLSETVTVGAATVCSPTWLWWGFTCSAGTVTAGQTLTSSTSNVLGGNAGGGVTFRVGAAPYRLYAEARYHYAPTANISTQFVTVALGVRY